MHPDKTCEELHNPCGSFCTNYEAEALAIEATINHLSKVFAETPAKVKNIVIFTDGLSVLQALENANHDNSACLSLALGINRFLHSYAVDLTLQWIPGHTDIQGNDRADTLAKRGATEVQTDRPASLQTAKNMIRRNNREQWLIEWAMGKTGRRVFKHMAAPNPKDALNSLARPEQAIVFRLRTQHIPLNSHLHRIKPDISPDCPLCDCPDETVSHHLFTCPALTDLRTAYLPSPPNFENTLYTNKQQLLKTCKFFSLSAGRRAQAQVVVGSVR